ncbi:MAG: hypothetical protein NPIRA04_10750 [Nitrospirales bacterium]|nr:MAG: hypothetical protein NPIRA04_10750 [Nitrospirales bacterium]
MPYNHLDKLKVYSEISWLTSDIYCKMKYPSLSQVFIVSVTAVVVLFSSCLIHATGADLELLNRGIVKIQAQGDHPSVMGTGVIVRIHKSKAFIFTASHVVEGRKDIKVSFFSEPYQTYPAEVLKIEADDRKGLGLIVVRGELPQDIRALEVSSSGSLAAGEDLWIIGHPLNSNAFWVPRKVQYSIPQGRLLIVSGQIEEGNSGGPLLKNNKVIGLIVEELGEFGHAVPGGTLQLYQQSWRVGPNHASETSKKKRPNHFEGLTCVEKPSGQSNEVITNSTLRKALIEGIRSNSEYWKLTENISDLRLEEDFLNGVVDTVLQNPLLHKPDKDGDFICVKASAEINVEALKAYVQRRISARDLVEEEKNSPLVAKSDFKLRISTNKPDNHFTDGEPLIVKIKSDRDAYLKMDYFMANGSVAHLIPAVYKNKIFIKQGQEVTIGAEDSEFAIEVGEPFGTEMIEVCASTQPYEGRKSTELFDDGRTYANLELRGIRIIRREREQVKPEIACSSLPIVTSKR